MGILAGALATSHAFAFIEPGRWDEVRTRNRKSYRQRYGQEPPVMAEIEAETPENIAPRWERLRAAHDVLRAQIAAAKADLIVIMGDDQNENLTSANMPQLALYTGGEFILNRRGARSRSRYKSQSEFSRALLERAVREEFDFAYLDRFADDELLSHAHWQFIDTLMPEIDLPVVLLFMNAIHFPAVTPRRCYAVGRLLRDFIAGRPANERVLIAASGGLSHFTAGYPWRSYSGRYGYGAISEEFDRSLIRRIEAGEGKAFTELTSEDLLEHGDIEFRAWIALLGAIGARPSQFAVYEPFYRAIGGMAVASWSAVP